MKEAVIILMSAANLAFWITFLGLILIMAFGRSKDKSNE